MHPLVYVGVFRSFTMFRMTFIVVKILRMQFQNKSGALLVILIQAEGTV